MITNRQPTSPRRSLPRSVGALARLFLLLGLGAGACTADDAGRVERATTRDSSGITVIEHPGTALDVPSALTPANEPSLRIGVVDGPAEQQFASIAGALRTPRGEIVILDRGADELRVFGADGRFLRRIGGSGQGPGEFTDPARLTMGPDGTLVVWDAGAGEVLEFDDAGALLRELPLAAPSLSAVAPYPAGDLLAVLEESPPGGSRPADGRMQNVGRLVRVARDGDSTTLASFPGTQWIMQLTSRGVRIQRPWYVPRLLAAASPAGVWVSDGMHWEVVRRSPEDGEIDRIVRFRTMPERFTPARIDEIHAAELESAGSSELRQSRQRRQAEAEYPETIPPIEDLFVDAEGRLWIGRLSAPPVAFPSGMGRATQDWVVLAAEGEEVLGTMSFPPRRRPLYADRDGVLLLALDDLDVPYVEWWPFVAGPAPRGS